MPIDWKSELAYIARMALAVALGFAIGVERKIRYKEAGMRTHSIVAGGAALMTLVGKYGFSEAAGDGARVAAQIVTGIGFLGAGIIMYRRDALHGLTTAAGIWATAGVGMAAGAGLYVLAAGGAALVIFVQWFLHLRIRLFCAKQFYTLRIKFTYATDESERVRGLFGVKRYYRISFAAAGDGRLNALAEIRTDMCFEDVDLRDILQANPFIASVERIEE
jgi:putative Mg2+ transporter-C (MgtC) family protein